MRSAKCFDAVVGHFQARYSGACLHMHMRSDSIYFWIVGTCYDNILDRWGPLE